MVFIHWVKITGLEKHLMIGSANSELIPLCYVGHSVDNSYMNATGWIKNKANDADGKCIFHLNLPTNRGGLKLYVKGARLDVQDADGTNYIDEVKTYIIDTASTLKDTKTDNRTASGQYDWVFGTLADCSARDNVMVEIGIITANAGNLDFMILLDCYYDT